MRDEAKPTQRDVTGRGRRGKLGAALPALVAVALGGCATTPPEGQVEQPPANVAASAPPAPELPHGVRLVGMESSALQGLLGRPALQRRERPAQYWRYSYAGCALDVFLYSEPPSGPLRVAYYEVRPDPLGPGLHNARCELIRTRLGPAEVDGGLPHVTQH